MKALILAAGIGSRLRPITDDIPKSMVEVNGKPILFKQIENLIANGVKDITIIAGYKADIIKKRVNEKFDNIKIVENKEYDSTNNMYSAYLSLDDFYNKEFILMNADVFYDGTILEELLNDKYINSIVVEENAYDEESMKVKIKNNNIYEISKLVTEEEAFGVSIDVYKFSKEGSIKFYEKIKEYIEIKKDLNQWTEVAINDVMKITEFSSCPLKGRWMEIDDLEDLKKAERIFNDDK